MNRDGARASAGVGGGAGMQRQGVKTRVEVAGHGVLSLCWDVAQDGVCQGSIVGYIARAVGVAARPHASVKEERS